MELCTVQKLQMFIADELKDCEYYKELAKIAPNEKSRQQLVDIAINEQSHAVEFQQIYRMMTCRSCNPIVIPPVIDSNENFNNLLGERVLNECNDYREYAEQYIDCCNNATFKNACFRASIDENVHAIELLNMLNTINLPKAEVKSNQVTSK